MQRRTVTVEEATAPGYRWPRAYRAGDEIVYERPLRDMYGKALPSGRNELVVGTVLSGSPSGSGYYWLHPESAVVAGVSTHVYREVRKQEPPGFTFPRETDWLTSKSLAGRYRDARRFLERGYVSFVEGSFRVHSDEFCPTQAFYSKYDLADFKLSPRSFMIEKLLGPRHALLTVQAGFRSWYWCSCAYGGDPPDLVSARKR